MKKIRLDGVIGWDIDASQLAQEIDGQDSLDITINSGGGDILEGFSMYNILDNFEGNIDIHIDLAASMASVIAMAGNTISMKKNSSIMMIHRPWGGVGGNSEDLRSHADTLDKLEDMLLNIYEQKTGKGKDLISSMLSDETYMNAAEALDNGFITHIDEVGRSSNLNGMALSVLRASSKVSIDTGKFAGKLNEIINNKDSVSLMFKNARTVSEIEKTLRQVFNLSRTESTAIVSAVKKMDGHGDHDHNQEALNTIKSFNFKNI